MDGAASPFRTPVVALDGPDKVTGAARYTFDVSLPGMLHAKVLRSPYPHAGILSIDTRRAEALPGVVAAVTGADAARLPDPYYGVAIRDQPVVHVENAFVLVRFRMSWHFDRIRHTSGPRPRVSGNT